MIELLLVLTTMAWCFAIHYFVFYEQIEIEKKEKKRLKKVIEEQNKKKQNKGVD